MENRAGGTPLTNDGEKRRRTHDAHVGRWFLVDGETIRTTSQGGELA